MNFDFTALLMVFDELLPLSDEEQKIFWFKSDLEKDMHIIFSISVYEKSCGIIINNNEGLTASSLFLENCTDINVLDKKCLEVLGENRKWRCFINLIGTKFLEFRVS